MLIVGATRNHNEIVLKTVNRKPICRPKDTDPVTFRFLVTKTGFATCRHYLNLS